MTAVVLIGFFLMLFAPCGIAVYVSREKRVKAAKLPIGAASEDVSPIALAENEEVDLPARTRFEAEPLLLVETETVPVKAVAVQKTVPVELTIAPGPVVHRENVAGRRPSDLKGIVAQAESEALVAHAMAAQANAAAMAATARAAQARAQAAAEHAVAAGHAAARYAAAVRDAEKISASTRAALAEQPAWPELAVTLETEQGSRQAA